jgi:very-short-patch-repair endonuclease
MTSRRQTNSIRGASSALACVAKQMRGAPTEAEAALWEVLRGSKLDGLRFRRQHPVGQFVLDFCCPALKLVVEVDGGIHQHQREQDANRDEWLRAYGYTTVRVTNGDVLTNLPAVLSRIASTAAALSPTR